MTYRNLPPAGWYDDPEHSGKLRWWDGQMWQSRWKADTRSFDPSGGLVNPPRNLQWFLSFTGRMQRGEWWLIYLVVVGCVIFVSVSLAALEQQEPGAISSMIFLLIFAAAMWLMVASNVKRLHDRGRSGWFLLIGLIPFGSIWVLIEVGFMSGVIGPNRYGPDPNVFKN